jgi:hypothetical protein
MTNQSTNKNVSDEVLYEYVIDEMEQSELIKGLWAKALAYAEGNDAKAKALYMQYRVQAIKDQLLTLRIDLGDLSKDELFEIIKNGFTAIPQELRNIKEQKIIAEEKAIVIAIKEEETKKENEKYSKFGGWLIVFAIFLVFGNLFSFIMVERFFENEYLDTLKLLDRTYMYGIVTDFKEIEYMSYISYGLLLAFTISFFRKDTWTKNLAILYFGFNIVANLITVYILQSIKLPTINIMSLVMGAIFQIIFAVIWISYFMVSKRVQKTFVKETASNATKTAVYVRDDSKQVVNDFTNNLMWQDNEDARTVLRDWQGAMDYCQNLNFAGHNDWRLPSIEELKTIVDKNNNPAIKSEFKNTDSNGYWSSTPYAGASDFAWSVYFSDGYERYNSKNAHNLVRCVRDSK